MNSFTYLVIMHTYREHNQRAGSLSKEALDLAPGFGTFSEILDGNIDIDGVFQLF